MDWLFLDGLLRGAAIALFGVLAGLLMPHLRVSRLAKLGTGLCLAAVCYLTLVIVPQVPEFWHVPILVGAMLAPGLFWLFSQCWFDDDFEFRPLHWLVIGGLLALGFFHVGTFEILPQGRLFMGLTWRGLTTAMILHGLWVIFKGRAADLVESRRRTRRLVGSATGIAIILILVGELTLTTWPPPPYFRLTSAVALLVLAICIAIGLLGLRDPALLLAPVAAKDTPSDSYDRDADAALLSALDQLMRRERLYRQEGLTIAAVSAKLDVPEYRMRRAINQGLGARNFNAYLNGFRLEDVQVALRDESQAKVPILTIALDAGFGSLAPFNRAFKSATGVTPTEFRSGARVD
jgi:AraC-like DNA-binding protein